MATRRFEAAIEPGHKGCAIILPFDPATAWGRRARHFVRGSFHGARYEAEVGHRWGRWFIVVGDDLLASLSLRPGDTARVTMTSRPRNVLDAPDAPRLPSIRLGGAVRRRTAGPRTAKRSRWTMYDVIYRYDPAHPHDRRPPGDADEACRRLEEGNRAFSSIDFATTDGCRVVPIDPGDIGVAASGGVIAQRPFAAVLGCSDARAPTELIFGCACNELFVVRVAGNVLGSVPLGSVGYAVDHLGEDLKLIVVLGHSGCGAVTAAVDAYLEPVTYLGLASTHQIRGIVDSLFPAVRGAARSLAAAWGAEVESAPGYRAALIECSVVVNAALIASILRESFGAPTKDRRVVFGVYDLATRRVHVPLAPDDGAEPVVGLRTPPETAEAIRRFAPQVARSGHVRRMLGR